MKEIVFAGIDIGGSSVKIGIVNEAGQLLWNEKLIFDVNTISPTELATKCGNIVKQLLQNPTLQSVELKGAGVGCPGKITSDGILLAAANFPNWKNISLKSIFQDALTCPVTLCNDANAAILAEKWIGVAKDAGNNCILLSTGVGVGAIIDGKLLRGNTNTIEGGHMIIERNGRPCSCSQLGCLEAYGSAKAIVEEGKKRLSHDFLRNLEQTTTPLTAKEIFSQAIEGNEVCLEIMKEAAEYVGIACVSLCRVLDPMMIILSGGIVEGDTGEVFLEYVRDGYKRNCWTILPNPAVIMKAQAGYNAGLIGAAAVAYNTYRSDK